MFANRLDARSELSSSSFLQPEAMHIHVTMHNLVLDANLVILFQKAHLRGSIEIGIEMTSLHN